MHNNVNDKNVIDPAELYRMGKAYLNGTDVEKNEEKAIELIALSAEAKYHDETRHAIDELILQCMRQKDFQGMAKWTGRLCDYLKATKGPGNVETLDTQASLAFVYKKLNDIKRARALITRVYNRKVELFGELAPTTVKTLCEKCCLYNPAKGDGNYFYDIITAAKGKLKLVKDIDDADVLKAYKNYANALEAYYDHPPFYVYEEMREWIVKFKGEGSADDISILTELSAIYFCLEFEDEALATEKLLLSYEIKNNGMGTSYAGALCERIAQLYFNKKRYKTAIRYLKKITDSLDHDAQNPMLIAEVYYNMAICYYMIKDRDEALKCVRKACDAFSSVEGFDEEITNNVRYTLHNALDKLESGKKSGTLQTRWLFGWAQLI